MGDTVHNWVSRRKKKTGLCSQCGQRRYTEWANVSGEYRRDPDDYIELCKPCHCKFDEWPRKGGTSWNAGRKAPQLGRKCEPGCACGRHRYWSRVKRAMRD